MNIKIISAVSLGLLLALPGLAQITFYATNLPSSVGDYNRSYYSVSNAYVASMLKLATNYSGPGVPGAGPGVPQVWDFSKGQQPSETVLRTDVLAVTNGPDGGDFPNATYAEKDTQEPSTQIAWRYYSMTNSGRYYYGFYVPLDLNASSLAVFDHPNPDIPATVSYGQTWSRTNTWSGSASGDPFDYGFTTTATVDAYGTLILPAIGSVPALRVHEVQDNQIIIPGFLTEDAPCDYYYWLVPGLGVAVQFLQNRTDSLGSLSSDNTYVERMFYANYITNTPAPVSYPANPGNLRIHLVSGAVQLTWLPFTNSASYQVQTVSSIIKTNWQVLGSTTATNWSETLTPTQRIYRVVGMP